MSLKHVDLESGFRRLAERRIEDAMREGKFDNLQGAGKPLDLQPMPAEENARLMWWALRIMRQNDVVPEEVRWRKAIDALRDKLDGAKDEAGVKAAVAQINRLVHKINTLGTTALKAPLALLSEERELLRLRHRATTTRE